LVTNAIRVCRIDHTDTIENYFENCPGCTKIFTTDHLELLPAGSVTWRGQGIAALAWVDPRALAAWDWATCELIDASFYALRPYVYFVFNGIYNGITLPLGLMMCPSESTAAIALWHTLLEECAGRRLQFHQMPVVADGHRAEKLYCQEFNRHLYMCLFHLPRTIGCPYVRGLVSRACYTYTEAHWVEIRDSIRVDIAAAVHVGMCGADTAAKAYLIIGWSEATATWSDFPHALFNRPSNVETSSNKTERMHALLNAHCRRGPVFARLVSVIRQIGETLDRAHEDQLRNARARAALVSGKADSNPACDCGYGEFWAGTYGVEDFACEHRMPVPLVQKKPLTALVPTIPGGLRDCRVLPGDELIRCWEDRQLARAGRVVPAEAEEAEEDFLTPDVPADAPPGTILRDLAADVRRFGAGKAGNVHFLGGTRQELEERVVMLWTLHSQSLAHPRAADVEATAIWKLGVIKRAQDGTLDELFR
jgi:hypothetical protein